MNELWPQAEANVYGACGDDARACRSLSGPPPKPSAAGSVGRRSRSGASEACPKGGTREKVNCPAGAREAALGRMELAATTSPLRHARYARHGRYDVISAFPKSLAGSACGGFFCP